MKDFPVFTTEFGVASLILKEIPYRKVAYIHIQNTLEAEKLLDECVSFCRVCGAERVYATGHECLETLPLHTVIWEMRGHIANEYSDVCLFPVTEKTASEWIRIYNSRMRNVANAATLEQRDQSAIIQSGGAYFVHETGNLIGIGWLDGEKLKAIASVQKGAGEKICRAMQSLCPADNILLEVSSTNQKAVDLYTRLGFIKTREVSRWYKVK